MTRKLSLTFLLFVVLALLIAACGSNDTIPPESSLEFPPDQIFYNSASSFAETPMVRFVGTAEDNVWVDIVEISFDDGVTWENTVIEGQGARVSWYYEAMSPELMTASVLQIRATDLSGNMETTISGQPYRKTDGTTTTELQTLINNAGTASTNDVIYLSSGAGGAYGDTAANGLALANTNPITIVGNGFDQTITISEGGISAITATSKTFLATSLSAAPLIRAGDDLYLRSLRIIGGQAGVLASAVGPLNLTVDDCVFFGQEGWGVKAEDTDGGGDVQVTVTGSFIDSSEAKNSAVRHGGILLDDVVFDVNGSLVRNHNWPSGSDAGLYIAGGAGTVSDSYFWANRNAIWVHNSSPVIDSCVVVGDPVLANTGVFFGGGSSGLLSNSIIDGNQEGYGVKIEGGTTPTLYRNTISNNTNWGVIFEGNFPGPNLPNLGKSQTSAPDNGLNSFLSNTAPSYVNANILVTNGSLGGTIIPAQGNWWGTANTNIVRSSIVDGTTWGGTVPTINYLPVSSLPP